MIFSICALELITYMIFRMQMLALSDLKGFVCSKLLENSTFSSIRGDKRNGEKLSA